MYKRLTTTIALLLTSWSFALAGVGGGPLVAGFVGSGSGNEHIHDIGKLSNGDVVVVGSMPLSSPWGKVYGFDKTHNGSEDGFVAILSADLSSVKRFTFFGGPANDFVTDVVVGNNDLIVIAGNTASNNLPVTTGVVGPFYSKKIDGFVAALSADLETVEFCTYINGDEDETPTDIALDQSGAIFVCGNTTSRTGFVTVNAIESEHTGGSDGFLLRLSANGASYQFATYFGSDGEDEFNQMYVDPSGSIYVAGTTTSASFPTHPRVNPQWWWLTRERPYDWTYNGGNTDATVTVFTRDGAQVVAASYFGGEGDDEGVGITLVGSNVMLVGSTSSPDLPTASGVQQALQGTSDCFLVSFDGRIRTLRSATYFGGSGRESVEGCLPYGSSDVLLWGTSTSADFPITGFGSRRTANGVSDAFFSIMNINGQTYSSLVGGPITETIHNAFVEQNGGVLLGGSTASPFLPLDEEKILVNAGEPGTTDATAIRFQRGAIDVISPSQTITVCEDNPINFGWTRTEMLPEDQYFLEVSIDGDTWDRMAGPTSLGSLTWTPPVGSYSNTQIQARIVSSRQHASVVASTIFIDALPTITTNLPETITECYTNDVALKIRASGKGLTYTWRKNGVIIPNVFTDSLVVNDIESGVRYTATVTARCGAQITSREVRVERIDTLVFTQQPTSQSIVLGKTLELRVATNGTAPTFQWYHNEVALPNKTTSVLRIPSVVFADSGRYLCIVKNECGESVSREAVVQVSPIVSVQSVVASTRSYVIQPRDCSEPTVTVSALNGRLSGEAHVISSNGSVVTSVQLENNSLSHTIPLGQLSNGVYWVVFYQGDSISIEKFVFVRH